MDWLGNRSQLVLIAVMIIVAGTWGFIELADEVIEGDTQTFDEWAVRAMRKPEAPEVPIGPTWLHEVGRDLTALGGIAILSLVTAGVGGYLLMIRKYHAFWLLVSATAGALLLSTVLKNAYDRERPSHVPHLSIVHTSSFPSGHSMMSSAVYLTLGVLLSRLVQGRGLKFYFLSLALLLAFLVGISRVYMGVHYPTDVLAGWTAGLVWALLCWLVARYLQSRGAIEKENEQTNGAASVEQDTSSHTSAQP